MECSIKSSSIDAESNSSSTNYPSKCPVCGRGGEPPVPLSVAAKQTGFPISKLRRAAKAGVFPSYRLGDARALVFVSEIFAALSVVSKGEP